MSKYIRTKDDKIVKVDIEAGIFTSRYEIVGEPKYTIEELCDAYICVYNNGNNHDIYYPYVIGIEDMKLTKNNNWYAAIWTDKGLIYVAKMNDKGELELI